MLLENKLRDLAEQKRQNDIFDAGRPGREEYARKSFDSLQKIISLKVERFLSADFICNTIDVDYDNSDIKISTKEVNLTIYGNKITISPTQINGDSLGISAVIAITNQSSRQKKPIFLHDNHGLLGNSFWKIDMREVYPSPGLYSIEESNCFLDAIAYLLP